MDCRQYTSAGDHADKDCDSNAKDVPSLEIRRITLAQGIEFNNSDLRRLAIPDVAVRLAGPCFLCETRGGLRALRGP